MTPHRVLIRADGGAGIGGGHIMRSLTLARALAPSEITVAATAETFAEVAALAARDIGRVLLSEPHAVGAEPEGFADVLIVDHYGLDARTEAVWAATARVTVVIDDLADRAHVCDLLIDPTLGRAPADYQGLVPPECTVLSGTEYALLRPEFATLRAASLERRRRGDRPPGCVLLSTGLGDPGGRLPDLAAALLAAIPGREVAVAVGGAAETLPALRALAAGASRLTLHVDSPDLAGLAAKSDLGIGAMGGTALERCCLGLPTLALVLADNQQRAATALARAGAVELADPDAPPDRIAERAAALLADTRARAEMSAAAAALVDGGGAQRVVAEIHRRL